MLLGSHAKFRINSKLMKEVSVITLTLSLSWVSKMPKIYEFLILNDLNKFNNESKLLHYCDLFLIVPKIIRDSNISHYLIKIYIDNFHIQFSPCIFSPNLEQLLINLLLPKIHSLHLWFLQSLNSKYLLSSVLLLLLIIIWLSKLNNYYFEHFIP